MNNSLPSIWNKLAHAFYLIQMSADQFFQIANTHRNQATKIFFSIPIFLYMLLLSFSNNLSNKFQEL